MLGYFLMGGAFLKRIRKKPIRWLKGKCVKSCKYSRFSSVWFRSQLAGHQRKDRRVFLSAIPTTAGGRVAGGRSKPVRK